MRNACTCVSVTSVSNGTHVQDIRKYERPPAGIDRGGQESNEAQNLPKQLLTVTQYIKYEQANVSETHV